MMTANADPAAQDDFVTCLAKAAAAIDKPPMIVTYSRVPVEPLMSYVFGAGATANLVVHSANGKPEFAQLDGARVPLPYFRAAVYAVFPRFLNSAAFDLIAPHYKPWLARVAGLIVHFPLSKDQTRSLYHAGLGDAHTFATQFGETTFYRRPDESPSPRPLKAAGTDRPVLRRLIIVDPCLGGAPGHYLPHARNLSLGAQALGAEVVWGCHHRLDDGAAPAGVKVRRCFPRSYIELSDKEFEAMDLSAELMEGWATLLGEFDDAGTHFLAHNLDSYLLRAAAGILESTPGMRSAVHLGLHTSPRRMVGRLQGDETHKVITQLRRAAAWEHSLFLWIENQRLGRWMSEWLSSPIPTLPMLAPSGLGAAASVRKPKDKLTISVLGESRREKGFLDLPGIVDRISSTPSLRNSMKLVIQNCPPVRGDLTQHELAVSRLQCHAFVEIIDGTLEAENYAQRLMESNVLLLPYDPAIYSLRGSGILAEGLSRGIAIVTRAGTAMEEDARDGVVLAYGTPEELIDILMQLVNDLDQTLDRARGMIVRFRGANNPERYVSALDERARGELPNRNLS